MDMLVFAFKFLGLVLERRTHVYCMAEFGKREEEENRDMNWYINVSLGVGEGRGRDGPAYTACMMICRFHSGT
jgi:hypothetical protein